MQKPDTKGAINGSGDFRHGVTVHYSIVWDMGAQISLLQSILFARQAGYYGHSTSVKIPGVFSSGKRISKIQYRVLLQRIACAEWWTFA
jgi:hypothetical protein